MNPTGQQTTPLARAPGAPPTTSAPPMGPVTPPQGDGTFAGLAPTQAKRVGRYVVDQAVLGAPPPQPAQQQQQQQQHAAQGSVPMMQHTQTQQQQQQQPPSPRQEAAHSSLQGKVHVSSPVRSADLATPDQALQCPDNFLCLTQGVVPSSGDLQKKTRLPFGAVCRPLCADFEVPCVNMGPSGIVRCKACRAYINPFVEFIEGGRKWRCNLCSGLNDVAGAYFAPLDGSGLRTDLARRPELSSGVVDFLAPAEYMVRPPMAPAYLFLLDVSYYAVQSGLLPAAIAGIRASLDHLPGKPRTRVGLITFDSTIQLYRLDRASPQMVVVPDVDDAALEPCPPDAVLCTLEQSRACFEAALNTIETVYATTTTQDSCVGPALRTALFVGRQLGCKVLVFTGSLSKLGAEGHWALPSREQEGAKAIGTDDENKLLRPHSDSYKNLGVELSKAQICVDVFSFAPYADLATLGSCAKVTGGRIHFYGTDATKSEADRQRLFYDVFYTVAPEQAWEGVMRLRCSKGVSINGPNVYGNFHIRSTDLLALPNVDSAQAYAFQLKVEENLTHIRRVSFQVALLYTSSANERRIRVLNKCLPVSSSMADVFRTANCEAVSDLLIKMAISRALEQRISIAREAVMNCVVDMLRVYKASFSAGSLGELVIPESLHMLPYFVLGMLKSPLLRVALGERLDRRAFLWHAVSGWPYKRTVQYLVPRAYVIRDEALQLNQPVKLSLQGVADAGGLVVLDNTLEIVFFVTRAVDVNLLATLFAVTSFEAIPATLPLVDSPVSSSVNETLQTLRLAWGGCSKVSVVRDGDARTQEVLGWLVEDKLHSPPLPSLPEFVRQLQNLVSQAAK